VTLAALGGSQSSRGSKPDDGAGTFPVFNYSLRLVLKKGPSNGFPGPKRLRAVGRPVTRQFDKTVSKSGARAAACLPECGQPDVDWRIKAGTRSDFRRCSQGWIKKPLLNLESIPEPKKEKRSGRRGASGPPVLYAGEVRLPTFP